MKWLFAVITLVITLYFVSNNQIYWEQDREDFKTEFQGAQKEFNQAVDDYYKEDLNSRAIPHNEASINEKNSTVAKVDTKIVVQNPVNNDKKVYKDSFDKSFDETNKFIQDKWKNF